MDPYEPYPVRIKPGKPLEAGIRIAFSIGKMHFRTDQNLTVVEVLESKKGLGYVVMVALKSPLNVVMPLDVRGRELEMIGKY